MASERNVVGFIDIGTNSIHLIVIDFVPGTLGIEIAREKEVMQMGRSLYKNGVIDQDSLEKLHLVVETFTKFAIENGAKKVYAMATCAAREATNREELLKALDVKGLTVRIIPGEEEARIIALGVLGDTKPVDNALLIDIGGGSTEMTVCNGEKTLFMDSLPLGAVRYAYGYPYDPELALKEEEYSSYQHNVDLHSYKAVKRIKELGFYETIGSSGTIEALADICSELYNSNPNKLRYTDLEKLMKMLRGMDIKERCTVPKLTANRADIIVAGGAIVEELMYLLSINSMTVVRRGLKEGMVMDYLQYNGLKNIDVRESSIRELAQRFRYNKDHVDEVGRFAIEIFDGLRDYGLHKMDNGMRDLLFYACILHDIGEYICYSKHHVSSYNIISNSNILGFDYMDINKIALMTRFHHKKMPSENDKLFSYCSPQEVNDLMKCILILRMADALDRHHLRLVKSIKIEKDRDRVIMRLYSPDNIDMEIWRLKDYYPDFERLFGYNLEVVSKR